MVTPPWKDGMAYIIYVNDIFRIFDGFSDMHSFDKLGSFTDVLESENLNPLICMFLLGFLGQVSRKPFSTITLAA